MKESKKKWQEFIQQWHNPVLQEGLGFLFDDMQLKNRDMNIRHRIVVSDILDFIKKLYSKTYSDNFYEYLLDQFVKEQSAILHKVETYQRNLRFTNQRYQGKITRRILLDR